MICCFIFPAPEHRQFKDALFSGRKCYASERASKISTVGFKQDPKFHFINNQVLSKYAPSRYFSKKLDRQGAPTTTSGQWNHTGEICQNIDKVTEILMAFWLELGLIGSSYQIAFTKKEKMMKVNLCEFLAEGHGPVPRASSTGNIWAVSHIQLMICAVDNQTV